MLADTLEDREADKLADALADRDAEALADDEVSGVGNVVKLRINPTLAERTLLPYLNSYVVDGSRPEST